MAKVKTNDNSWLSLIGVDDLNENFIRIYSFYVLYSPCVGLSPRCKTLADYGWSAPFRKPFYLNKQLKKASNNEKLIFSAKTKNDMDEALRKAGLLEEFLSDMNLDKVVIHNNKNNQFISTFYHIRNAIAHGRFNIQYYQGEKIYVVEDQTNEYITARMILRERTLLNWIDIIERGETTYEH